MAIKITKDRRTIRTGADYTRFRHDLFEQQEGECQKCGRETSLEAEIESDFSFHVHHPGGRGLGGSRRDDNLKTCIGLCGADHRRIHNQQ